MGKQSFDVSIWSWETPHHHVVFKIPRRGASGPHIAVPEPAVAVETPALYFIHARLAIRGAQHRALVRVFAAAALRHGKRFAPAEVHVWVICDCETKMSVFRDVRIFRNLNG